MGIRVLWWTEFISALDASSYETTSFWFFSFVFTWATYTKKFLFSFPVFSIYKHPLQYFKLVTTIPRRDWQHQNLISQLKVFLNNSHLTTGSSAKRTHYILSPQAPNWSELWPLLSLSYPVSPINSTSWVFPGLHSWSCCLGAGRFSRTVDPQPYQVCYSQSLPSADSHKTALLKCTS